MADPATLAARVLGADVLDNLRAREEVRDAGVGLDVVRKITEQRGAEYLPELVADLIPAADILQTLERSSGYDAFVQALWMGAETLPAKSLVPLCADPEVARRAVSFLSSQEGANAPPELAWTAWRDRADRSLDVGLAVWCVRCGVRGSELLDALVGGIDSSLSIEPNIDDEGELLSTLDAVLHFDGVTPEARRVVGRLLDRPWLAVNAAAASALVALMPDGAVERIRQARDALVDQPQWDGFPRRRLELVYASALWRLGDEPDRQEAVLVAALPEHGFLERFEALRQLSAAARERGDALTVLVKQLDAGPRADVIQALGRVGPAAAPAENLLRQVVAGGNGALQIEATLALGAIIGAEAAVLLEPTLLWDPDIKTQLRHEGLRFWLGAGVGDAHRPYVAELLRATDDRIRVSVAIAEDARRARLFLGEILADSHPEGVATAWRTLGREFWMLVSSAT